MTPARHEREEPAEERPERTAESLFSSQIVQKALIPIAVLAAGAYINSTLAAAIGPIREEMGRTAVVVGRLSDDVKALSAAIERDRSEIVQLRIDLAGLKRPATVYPYGNPAAK